MNTNSTVSKRTLVQRSNTPVVGRSAGVVLVAALALVAGCKDRRRGSFGAGPSIPCSGEFSVEVAPAGYVVRGVVHTLPATRVMFIDRRLGEAMAVSDPSGTAQLATQVSGRLPEFAMFQCGVIGDRERPHASGNAPLRLPPRIRANEASNSLTCEGRSCSIVVSGASVRVSGDPGTQVTVGDRTVTLTGRAETIAYDAAQFTDGVALGPSDNSGWNNFRRTRIQRPVTVRFADGVELRSALFASTWDLSYAYGQYFSQANQRAVLQGAAASSAQGALLFSNNTLSNVFGPVQRLADVRYVGFIRRGAERRASCGRYRRGTQVVQVDRVMQDGTVEVFDPRTGQRVHSEVIRAPEARCSNTMRTVADAMSEFSLVDADRAFARFLGQRMGGSIPAALAFESAETPAAPTAGQVAAQGNADAGAGSTAEEPPTSRPDPSFAATLRAALGASVRVTDATADTDSYSKATERTASVSNDDDSVQVRFVDYETAPEPNRARIRVRGNLVTMVPREDDETATEANVRALLSVSATSSASMRSALQRMGWTASSDPDDSDEGDGVRNISATASKGDVTLNVYVRSYAGVAHGGDEPRAIAIRGSRVWIVSGGTTRAFTDRVLRAVAR